MNLPEADVDTGRECVSQIRRIRISGIVQGVGFRPTVWQYANELGLAGDVRNDGEGVLISVVGSPQQVQNLIAWLQKEPPPLSRIDKIGFIESLDVDSGTVLEGFKIIPSIDSAANTSVTPDACICSACLKDIMDPFDRRFRYALTNCTHCGPRFSIVHSIPYDRRNTSMSAFSFCEKCRAEYVSPQDRRYHAQPNACRECGPEISLSRLDGRSVYPDTIPQLDAVGRACTLLQNGEILLVKGIGGFHLACDATNHKAVARLREIKKRDGKPFALMARDIEIISRYASCGSLERDLLTSTEAPIVLLERRERSRDTRPICGEVAPGCSTLGFMLPYTPMHCLLLERMEGPIVLTSANHSEHPQIISNDSVKDMFAGLVDYVLWHNRDITNRVDDSVVRVMSAQPRVLRRSRGYAPAPVPLPCGFNVSKQILAAGGELKNTFCLIKGGNAILSQHIGDLENAPTNSDYLYNINLYARLFDHQPDIVVVDAHPEYLSSKYGREFSKDKKLHLEVVQHHHAHITSCMAENNWSLHAGAVLGVSLDGLGYGDDGTIWGGEFLLVDYFSAERLATFKPVPMLGGTQAVECPWRNTYTHLIEGIGWNQLVMNFSDLELVKFFQKQPIEKFNSMLRRQVNIPLASSCGRLFDAVAAALGICRESISYEGQAAVELEAMVDQETLDNEDEAPAYPFSIHLLGNLPYIEPQAMWRAVLDDLILKTPRPVMAARFHKGLAKIIVAMIKKLTVKDGGRVIDTVALSGGVFQNKVLFELVVGQLQKSNYKLLTHRRVSANDGGLALGQAVIGAARTMNSIGE